MNTVEIPKEEWQCEDITKKIFRGKTKTEFLVHAKLDYAPEEINREFQNILQNNKLRKISIFTHALETVHFKEVGFFLFLHQVFTNMFQLITQIEKYIAKFHSS